MTIDLRSDTVTRPVAAMRRAMAEAEVGDDVFGEDPTVRRLEERAAALFEKEAGLFVPSGTMANQLALQLYCRPGDEVLLAPDAHCYHYESGALGALAGAQPRFIGTQGVFGAAEVEAALRPRTDYYPRTVLVWFENTHNASGGRVFPLDRFREASLRAEQGGLGRHLDGARIFNACAASGTEPRAWGALVDSLSFCFSKGLGAPVGSILLGSREAMGEARFLRRRLGGAMRQVGVLAAAADYALVHHRARLEEDHQHARLFAEAIAGLPGVVLDLAAVQTNLVSFDLGPQAPDAPTLSARLQERGVLVIPMGARRVRVVTHMDVSREQVEQAARVVAEVLEAS